MNIRKFWVAKAAFLLTVFAVSVPAILAGLESGTSLSANGFLAPLALPLLGSLAMTIIARGPRSAAVHLVLRR